MVPDVEVPAALGATADLTCDDVDDIAAEVAVEEAAPVPVAPVLLPLAPWAPPLQQSSAPPSAGVIVNIVAPSSAAANTDRLIIRPLR
jgi:hypothetical protein